jgi:hypothetical protein
MYIHTISVLEPENETEVIPCMLPPFVVTPDSVTIPSGISTARLQNMSVVSFKTDDRLLVTITINGQGEVRMESIPGVQFVQSNSLSWSNLKQFNGTVQNINIALATVEFRGPTSEVILRADDSPLGSLAVQYMERRFTVHTTYTIPTTSTSASGQSTTIVATSTSAGQKMDDESESSVWSLELLIGVGIAGVGVIAVVFAVVVILLLRKKSDVTFSEKVKPSIKVGLDDDDKHESIIL